MTNFPFQFGRSPFYFLRHGETNDSVRGIVQGQRETILNDKGRETARKAARLLSSVNLGCIYASPLRRTWETAEIISQGTRAPVRVLPGLMERNWGDYQGRPKDTRPLLDDPIGVERTRDFETRVLEAMKSIVGPSPILVVAHSGVFRVLSKHADRHIDRSVEVNYDRVFKFDPPARQRRRWNIGVMTDRRTLQSESSLNGAQRDPSPAGIARPGRPR